MSPRHKERKIFSRDFSLLYSGHLVSNTGNSIFLIVMLLYIREITGSPLLVASVQAAMFIPVALLSVYGGAAADSFSRRKILVITDLLRGCAMLILAATVWIRPDAALSAALAASLCIGVGSAYFAPAAQSMLPQTVSPNALNSANALRMGGLLITAMAGNAVGGVLYVAAGTSIALLINGISYILSAGWEALISQPYGSAAPGKRKNVLRRLSKHEGCHAAMLISFSCIYPVVVVSLPFFVVDLIGASHIFVGILAAAAFAGSILGYFAAGICRRCPPGMLFRPSFAAAALALLIMSAVPYLRSLPWRIGSAAGALILLGCCASVIYLTAVSSIQRITDNNRLGRVFGIVEARTAVATPAGYIIGGIMLQVGEIQPVLAVLAIFLSLIAYAAGRPSMRACMQQVHHESSKPDSLRS